MERKKLKVVIIVSIIVLLTLVAILILIITKISKDNNNALEPKVVRKDEKSNTSYDTAVYVEEGGAFYSSSGEPADGVDFECYGIPDEVLKYIKDIKAFYATIRTYAFSYGFNKKAKSATYSRHEYQEETKKLAIEFLLDDGNKTKFITIINLENNTVQISY